MIPCSSTAWCGTRRGARCPRASATAWIRWILSITYGADALRFSLAMGISPGNDTRYTDEKTEAARNFVNKVWNASRFVLMNMETREEIDRTRLTLPDQWILSQAAN